MKEKERLEEMSPVRKVNNRVSWRFFSEYLGAKLALYAEDEGKAWEAFRVVVQPSVQAYFRLVSVEGSPYDLEVKKT